MITPGYIVFLARNGKIISKESAGYSNIKRQIKISSNTQFRLASLTKPFTLMLILYLVKESKLKLNDTLTKYFPELPNWKNKITIENLLSHTSGLPDCEKVLNSQKLSRGKEPNNDSVLEILVNSPKLDFKPGQTQVYSESGYVLLALLIERITGNNYADSLKELILKPLSMKNTLVFDQPKKIIANRAYGYKFDKFLYREFDYDTLNFIVGNEGVYSSAHDLAKWSQAWFSGSIVPKSLIRMAIKPTKLNNGFITDRGYSFNLSIFGGEKIYYHTGSWVGFRLMMVLFPKKNIAGYILSNSTEYDKETKRVLPILNLLCKYSQPL